MYVLQHSSVTQSYTKRDMYRKQAVTDRDSRKKTAHQTHPCLVCEVTLHQPLLYYMKVLC